MDYRLKQFVIDFDRLHILGVFIHFSKHENSMINMRIPLENILLVSVSAMTNGLLN